ncbi:MAG: tetratricopeptide repeat protein, partial [Verrucomicrobiota bacterium]
IENWKNGILPIAKKIAESFPLRFHGLDIMVDRNKGPQVVEVNARPGLAIQLANGRGLAGLLKGLSLVGLGCLLAAPPAVALEPSEKLAEARKAAAEKPGDVTLQNDLAVALHQAGRTDEAIGLLLKVVETKPDYARAQFNLGSFHLEQNDLVRARQALEESVRFDPLYTEAWYNLGLVLMRQDEHAAAADRFKRVTDISRSPRHYRAWYNLGLCHAALDRHQDAVKAYDGAIRLNPGHVESYINRGISLSRLGRNEIARRSYKSALKLQPGNRKAKLNLALALRDAQLPEEARAVLSSMSQADRNRPEMLGLAAGLLMDLKRYDHAAKAYSLAYQASQKSEHLYNMARAYTAGKQVDRAIELYRSVLRVRPDYDEAALNLELIYSGRDDYEKAEATLRDLIARVPERAEAHYRLGVVLGRQEQHIAGIGALREAVRLEPGVAKYWYGLALAENRAGEAEPAIAHYEQAEKLDPNDARFPYNRGKIYLDREDYAPALAAFNRAVDIKPKYVEAINNRGLAFLRSGQPEPAMADFKKLIELNPKNSRAWVNLGRVHSYRREVPSAARAYGPGPWWNHRLWPRVPDGASDHLGGWCCLRGGLGGLSGGNRPRVHRRVRGDDDREGQGCGNQRC